MYALTGTEYQGIQLGLVSVIMHPRDISEGGVDPFGQAHERDVVRIYLGSSHDGGNSWHLGALYANSTLLHTGGAGSFDKGTMLPGG